MQHFGKSWVVREQEQLKIERVLVEARGKEALIGSDAS